MLERLFSVLDYLISVLLVIAVFFVTYCPIWLSYLSAEIMGTFLFLVDRKRLAVIYENFDIAYPEGTPFDRHKMARKVYVHLILVFVDFFIGRRLLNKDTWQEFVSGDGIDFMREKVTKVGDGRGGIFAVGHIGSFLASAFYPPLIGFPCRLVIRGQGGSYVTNTVTKLFERAYQKVTLRKNAYEELQKTIEDGEFAVIATDQHTRKGLRVKFWGREASCAVGVAALARTYKVPIYSVVIMRTGRFRFVAYAVETPYECTDDKQADLVKMTESVNEALVSFIKKHPEQWFWMHRRWR